MAIGEFLIHYNSVRVQVLGAGNLHVEFLSMPDVDGNQRSYELVDINMDTIGRRIPTCLANFREQAVQLHLSTDEIDDVFTINRILIFKLPTETSYPG